jgi:sugar (pentulose or hexulose) kinase
MAPGTNDATSLQVGAGNGKVNDVLNIAGSSDMVSILTDKPETNDSFYLWNFCGPGVWHIYATTAGGFVLDWLHEQMYRDMDAEVKHALIEGLTLESNQREIFAAALADLLQFCKNMVLPGAIIKVTGGIVSPEIMALKTQLFSQYMFEFRQDCALICNTLLALHR